MVLGPPLIHSRMQALFFFFMSTALAIKLLVKAIAGEAIAAAPAKCDMKCRRVISDGMRK